MTVMECLIHLADYIEPTRRFEDCIRLRQVFYSRLEAPDADKWQALYDTLFDSFDMSITSLIESGEPIAIDSVKARNWLLEKKTRNLL